MLGIQDGNNLLYSNLYHSIHFAKNGMEIFLHVIYTHHLRVLKHILEKISRKANYKSIFLFYYLDSRMKNECLEGSSCSVRLQSVLEIIKPISSKSDLIKDSCTTRKNVSQRKSKVNQ